MIPLRRLSLISALLFTLPVATYTRGLQSDWTGVPVLPGEAPRNLTAFADCPDIDFAYPTTRWYAHDTEGKPAMRPPAGG